jgi:hypothetical protein
VPTAVAHAPLGSETARAAFGHVADKGSDYFSVVRMREGLEGRKGLGLDVDVEGSRLDEDRLNRSRVVDQQHGVGALRKSGEEQFFRMLPVSRNIPIPWLH